MFTTCERVVETCDKEMCKILLNYGFRRLHIEVYRQGLKYLRLRYMWQNTKALKDISRSLTNIYLLQKQKEGSTAQKRFSWLRIANWGALVIFVLLVPYFINHLSPGHNNLSATSREDSLGVEKLVRQIQSEIEKSEQERKAKNIAPMFELKSFELEISFVAKRTSTQEGSAHFEIVTVDNQLQTGAEQTHRLKLLMEVVPREGTTKQSESPPPAEGQLVGPVPPGISATQREEGKSK